MFVECTVSLTDAIYFKTLPLWHSDTPLTVAHAESTYLNFCCETIWDKRQKKQKIWYFEIQNTECFIDAIAGNYSVNLHRKSTEKQ